MDTRVGNLRQQTALQSGSEPIVVITEDAELLRLLEGRKLKVESFYPDTTDGNGEFNPSFKIEVSLDE